MFAAPLLHNADGKESKDDGGGSGGGGDDIIWAGDEKDDAAPAAASDGKSASSGAAAGALGVGGAAKSGLRDLETRFVLLLFQALNESAAAGASAGSASS